MQADGAVVTVRLWFDRAGRRRSGYGEAAVRSCGQVVRTVARESVGPNADHYELCETCCIRDAVMTRV